MAVEFSRPLRGGAIPRDPAALGCPDVRDEVARPAAELPEPARQLARLALYDPELLLRKFQNLLHGYWDHAFRSEWSRVQPSLAAAVTEAGRLMAGGGLHPALAGVSAELRVISANGHGDAQPCALA